MIYEYKLEMSQGGMICPPWVEDGGYFRDPDNKTMVGWSPDESDRDYYIPDTVTTCDKQSVIDRCLDIHSRYPYENSSGSMFTDDEVIAMVTTWFEDKELND